MPAERRMIELWTDGACKGNPGPGGWGAILLISDQAPLELSGYDPATTNNRMELTAVIEGLKALPDRAGTVTVHTDSQLVVKGMTEWIAGWQRKQWRKSDGDPVLNAELWRALLAESQRLGQVRWQWVRGHSGVPLNERADQLAVAAIERRGGIKSTANLSTSPPTSIQAPLPAQQPVQDELVLPSKLELSELDLLRELEQRVRRAVGPHRGQVPVYDEVLGKLDALRKSAIVANPSKTRSSRI
jgi:ribonuclease HI